MSSQIIVIVIQNYGSYGVKIRPVKANKEVNHGIRHCDWLKDWPTFWLKLICGRKKPAFTKNDWRFNFSVSVLKEHMQQTMKLHTWNRIKYRNYLQFEPIENIFRLVNEIMVFSYTVVAPEILLIEWQKTQGTLASGVCKNKYCFAHLYIQ